MIDFRFPQFPIINNEKNLPTDICVCFMMFTKKKKQKKLFPNFRSIFRLFSDFFKKSFIKCWGGEKEEKLRLGKLPEIYV